MTRVWPDEVASAADGGDKGQFLSLPQPAFGLLTICEDKQVPTAQLESSASSLFLPLLHSQHCERHILTVVTSVPLGGVPSPSADTFIRALSAQVASCFGGLAQSPSPWVPPSFWCLLLCPASSKYFWSSTAGQGLGYWGL